MLHKKYELRIIVECVLKGDAALDDNARADRRDRELLAGLFAASLPPLGRLAAEAAAVRRPARHSASLQGPPLKLNF